MDSESQRYMLDHDLPIEHFDKRLSRYGLAPLRATGVEILQLNITRRCNMNCKHCHVNAGAHETSEMSAAVLDKCLEVAAHDHITTVDITGGCPEMHPSLEWLLRELAKLGKRLIVRSNLVVLNEPRYRHFIDVYAQCSVEVAGSLPDYKKSRTDAQRGAGTFDKAITALKALNKKGYGSEDTGLTLDLVHNPAGAWLPGNQAALEQEYKTALSQEHGIRFNSLFCLTNCPAGRYLDYLVKSDNLNDYMQTLARAYNPAAAQNVMCRTTLSVGPDGTLYDCDFNQMLDMAVNHGAPAHVDEYDSGALANRTICTANHCYCCTAGAGSSCQGAVE